MARYRFLNLAFLESAVQLQSHPLVMLGQVVA
jgi:hypothetical protein